MKRVSLWMIGIGLFITVGFLTVKQGYAEEEEQATVCNVETLKGTYVLAATGFNTPTSGGVVSLQPKAIVEVINFNGDGTLTVPAATLNTNGAITRTVNGSGSYTVAFDCTGTITFAPSAPNHDIFIAPNGKEYYWIQTDLNKVIAGVARRVSPE